MQKVTLLGSTREELEKFLISTSEKFYRTDQIFYFLYKKKELNIDNFYNLPLKLREILKQKTRLSSLKILLKETSNLDSTTRYNFLTLDNKKVSAVYIPKHARNVVCVSTQIGCSVGCKFCNSTKKGFFRNLTTNEIIEQIFWIEKDVNKIDGVLFMGMGEPLLNFENVIKAIEILVEEKAFGISRRKITLSTVGIVPNIIKLKQTNLAVKLAISLHSYSDEIRKKLIKNLNFSIQEILNAAVDYAEATNTRTTLEYVLIKGINDTLDDLFGLINLLKKMPRKFFKINLIPYNCISKNEKFFSPELTQIEKFKNELRRIGFLVFIRKPHGQDIDAACGQLGF
ncbi:MAG: 23S rRNA (adenine(2503)-C(2))-methyltransferase RlmN [Endomicrobia bacterium]|nr:23S rRNA (adenine(2503)-C(2))-methyltransferase RlmN [Endomicrobiia bacterium]